MRTQDLFLEFACRPLAQAQGFMVGLSSEILNAHPAGHDNSIAWLLWHTGREMDLQVEALGGAEVWASQGFRELFGLGELGDSVGYGHSPAQARAVVVNDSQLLLDYLAACTRALCAYAGSLSETDFDEIIDRQWDPPVTRGVRLVSIVDDATQHMGQASYALGQLSN